MMILKLFIIPWIWTHAQNVANNPAAAAAPPTAPNAQFVDIPFYHFLQRQNQINNAILLNNAMLANSLGAMPPSEHQIPIPNTLQFPAAATALQANHAALFPNFQPKFPTVPAAGFNRLGIYDVLNRGVKLGPVPAMLIPSQATPSSTTAPLSVQPTTTLTPQKGEPNKEDVQESDPIPIAESDPIPIGVSEPDERMRKVIDLSATPRQKPTPSTEIPPLTELIEEIGGENVITTTTEQVIDVTSTKKPKQDVYKLLKTLNLTDEETNDLVSHVEKVVREELVRKLTETRFIDRTTTPEKSTTTAASTTEAGLQTTTTAQLEEEVAARIRIPLRRTKPEKELLFYIPRKKPKAEIKHHPQRLSSEDRSDFVEAEILTSQMHLPVQEKIDEDTSEAVVPVFGTDAYEPDKSQEAASTPTTTLATTTTTQAPTTSSVVPTTSVILHQKILVRELNVSVDNPNPKPNAQYGGVDADLLGIGFPTGAPLDLENEGNRLVAYRTRNLNKLDNKRASSTPQPPPTFQHPLVSRTKTTSPPKTPFERLAVDYKERLTGAGDMDKILKSLYSNAYIALVDAKEASSVRIPLSMRRAQAGGLG